MTGEYDYEQTRGITAGGHTIRSRGIPLRIYGLLPIYPHVYEAAGSTSPN